MIVGEDYYLDNYGSCELGPKCQCLKNKWKGQLCEHWQPLGIKSLQELENYFRKNYGKTNQAR